MLPVHFNSRTSCEVRRSCKTLRLNRLDFNSRTSCEVRRKFGNHGNQFPNFNSRTSCEVRPEKHGAGEGENRDFNSRTSCEVRPGRHTTAAWPLSTFQLTHLLRGATPWQQLKRLSKNFNSRTSCEVRLKAQLTTDVSDVRISTHAPLARCDNCWCG